VLLISFLYPPYLSFSLFTMCTPNGSRTLTYHLHITMSFLLPATLGTFCSFLVATVVFDFSRSLPSFCLFSAHSKPKDDKKSLAELHQFLNSPDTADLIDLGLDQAPLHDTENEYVKELERFHASKDKGKQPASDKPASITSSMKSERRRSLPTPVTSSGASFMSMDSSLDYHYLPRNRDRADSILGRDDATIRNTDDQDPDFQMRRKKAAKLTQFFGVNYRDLIRDVLDSIESGLEVERHKGTVSKEEAEVRTLSILAFVIYPNLGMFVIGSVATFADNQDETKWIVQLMFVGSWELRHSSHHHHVVLLFTI